MYKYIEKPETVSFYPQSFVFCCNCLPVDQQTIKRAVLPVLPAPVAAGFTRVIFLYDEITETLWLCSDKGGSEVHVMRRAGGLRICSVGGELLSFLSHENIVTVVWCSPAGRESLKLKTWIKSHVNHIRVSSIKYYSKLYKTVFNPDLTVFSSCQSAIFKVQMNSTFNCTFNCNYPDESGLIVSGEDLWSGWCVSFSPLVSHPNNLSYQWNWVHWGSSMNQRKHPDPLRSAPLPAFFPLSWGVTSVGQCTATCLLRYSIFQHWQ